MVAGQADSGFTQCLNRHGDQCHGLLFAGGQQHIHFPWRWGVADLPGEFDQFVRFVATGTDDHDHLIAGAFRGDSPLCSRHDSLSIRDARTPKLLNDQCHERIPSKVPLVTNRPPHRHDRGVWLVDRFRLNRKKHTGENPQRVAKNGLHYEIRSGFFPEAGVRYHLRQVDRKNQSSGW